MATKETDGFQRFMQTTNYFNYTVKVRVSHLLNPCPNIHIVCNYTEPTHTQQENTSHTQLPESIEPVKGNKDEENLHPKGKLHNVVP